MRALLAILILASVCLPAVFAVADPGTTAQSMYRYTNKQGRVVYTNISEQVPLPQREHARMDLSRISLNTEVGTEIDRRLEEEHAQLTKSPYCTRLRAAVEAGFFPQLWEDFAPLIVCGGILLLFLFFTPAALRRFGAPVWAKVLMMAIPSLAVAGLMMFSMTYTNKTIATLKQRAKPCATETFTKLSTQQDALLQHAQLVDQLKQEIAKLDHGRAEF